MFSERFENMSEEQKQKYLNQNPKFSHKFNKEQNSLNLNKIIGTFGDVNLSENLKDYNNNGNNFIRRLF